VKESLNLELSFTNVGSREQLQEDIYKAAEKVIQEREQEFGEEFLRFLQVRYLVTIDTLWKDHLLAMDHLRQGIGLRGYGQKDPKQEYKKEGYNGFMQMLGAISTQFAMQMMRVQAKAASAAAEETARLARQMAQRQRQMQEGRADAEGKLAENAAARPAAATRPAAPAGGPKLGRNDPCHCGSGKKYKKCHGASEASV
jgi:preprotein translocase subunit SecA